MQWVNDLRKLRQKNWPERGRLVEAGFLLGLMRAAVLLISFRRLAGWLRLIQGNVAPDVNSLHGHDAAEIGRAVVTAAARTPWVSTCLTQTLATALMLRRRSIPCTLCLGVAKDSTNLIAHAWLRCGNVILTGAGGHDRFATVSSFSSSESVPGFADVGGQ